MGFGGGAGWGVGGEGRAGWGGGLEYTELRGVGEPIISSHKKIYYSLSLVVAIFFILLNKLGMYIYIYGYIYINIYICEGCERDR